MTCYLQKSFYNILCELLYTKKQRKLLAMASKMHLLNIYSEAHFFLLDFIWHIYDGYVKTYDVPLYLHEFVIRTNHTHIIVYCLALSS